MGGEATGQSGAGREQEPKVVKEGTIILFLTGFSENYFILHYLFSISSSVFIEFLCISQLLFSTLMHKSNNTVGK